MDITGLLDNYNLIYTYGFWFIIGINKSFKFLSFLGNDISLTVA